MQFFEKFQSGLEKIVGPFAEKVGNSKSITAMTEGFMATMPITLGVAVIAVLGNLPFDPWLNFIQQVGLYQVAQNMVSLTLSMLAVYVVGAIAYNYARNEGENGIAACAIALAVFMALIPIQTPILEDGSMAGAMVLTSHMGSDGIFIALIVGILIGKLYCWLLSKNIRLNMPDSVPPMVSQSMSPVFVAMIIFTLVFVVRYVCSLTPYGDVFTLVNTLIGTPIMYLGASPVSLIIVFTLMNLVWFFGIHPNAILMCYMPVLIAVQTANIQAFVDGNPLPYLTFAILGTTVQIGGAGNTLGLCVATLFAKSEKYKTMRKVVIPADIFNINEPIIFGFPIVMNPLYFIPMVLSPIVSALFTLVAIMIVPISFNPAVSMPWVTPGFITVALQGGLWLMLIWFCSVALHFVIYLPFFMIDDHNALKLEQANAKEAQEETEVQLQTASEAA